MGGLLFWDETVQKGYKAWIKELLTKPNPHGGPPIGQDPAFAILQIQNEDSLLFWTMLGPLLGQEPQLKEQNRRLREAYGKWATKKYGSLDKANGGLEGPAPTATSSAPAWPASSRCGSTATTSAACSATPTSCSSSPRPCATSTS